MVSRYEEYLSFMPDRFGRFRASESIATTGNFLNVPIVNIWVNLLKDKLKKAYPALRFRERKFRFVPTIDIDHAYAFQQRSFIRTIGGYARSLMDGDLAKVVHRSNVLLGIEKDPYDQYDYIIEIHKRYGLQPMYFVLFADYGKDDNNVTLSRLAFRQLIQRLNKVGNIGIHPSLTSGKYPLVFDAEIKGLTEVLGHEITLNRQHFLKTIFPVTYDILIKNGITDDYSMGYATNTGFRAGIADPFPFFNILANKTENLILHPVTLMDVTMRDYLHQSHEEAIQMFTSIIDTIKALNGEFVSVWHNESFDETGRWSGWRNVYENLLSYAVAMMNAE